MAKRERPPMYQVLPGIVLGVAAAAVTSVGFVVGLAVKAAKNAVRRRRSPR